MHELTKIIKEDMCPALGVTEPGSIAFSVAKACAYLQGNIDKIEVKLNSGIYKNAYTCGIPGSPYVGNLYSAALGAVCGDPEKGLECLAGVDDEANRKADEMVKAGKVEARLSTVSSRIDIRATVFASGHKAEVIIQDSHVNVVCILVDGKVVFGEYPGEPGTAAPSAFGEDHPIHNYTLKQIFEYAKTVPFGEISFVLEAYKLNLELAEAGIASERCDFAREYLKKNGGKLISEDEVASARAVCAAAADARISGLPLPAMSISGSGTHGIIATMPIYAAWKIGGFGEEALARATVLSYAICIFIKEYSGKLSAYCGCSIAAGTGAAAGIAMLKGKPYETVEEVIYNMANGITGMICDGGNKGCVIKALLAVDAASVACSMAFNGVKLDRLQGIGGRTVEDTMHNIGKIASPGMTATEGTIVEIMENK